MSEEKTTKLVSAVTLNSTQKQKLETLISKIPDILKKSKDSQYDEIFGYRINVVGEDHVEEPIRNEILLKFLIANDYDVDVTVSKIAETLNWRAEFQPLSAAYNEKFPEELNQLGVVSVIPTVKITNYKVGTWNLYGNVKHPKVLFEQFGGNDSKRPGTTFLRWRVGLMERSLSFLDYNDPENHKIVQIHDYKNVSMFNIDKGMKAATKEIIKIFGDNYPELLSTKFFINIPSLMSWVFGFFTTIGVISKETLQKFRPLNHGNMSEWFPQDILPKSYGGPKSETKSIFDMDKYNDAEIPSYGKIVLEKLNKSTIEEMNLSVE